MSGKDKFMFTLSDIDEDIVPLARSSGRPLFARAVSKKPKHEVCESSRDASVSSPILLDFGQCLTHNRMVMEQMSRCYNDRLNIVESLKEEILEKDILLKRLEAENIKFQEEIIGLREKKKQAQDVIAAKNDAIKAIYETKINMASEASSRGLDTSFWEVSVWKKKLEELVEAEEEERMVNDMILDMEHQW